MNTDTTTMPITTSLTTITMTPPVTSHRIDHNHKNNSCTNHNNEKFGGIFAGLFTYTIEGLISYLGRGLKNHISDYPEGLRRGLGVPFF
jgi:hypothetical protein